MALYLQAVPSSLSRSLCARPRLVLLRIYFSSASRISRDARTRPRPRECERECRRILFRVATCIAPDIRGGRARRGEARRGEARRDGARRPRCDAMRCDETRRDATRIFDFATSLEIIGVRISDPTASAIPMTPMKSIVTVFSGIFSHNYFLTL